MSIFDFVKKNEKVIEEKKTGKMSESLISDQFGISESRANEIIKEVMFALLIDPTVKSAGDLIKFVRTKYSGDEREFALYISARASEKMKQNGK
jgi:hypothetical protein